MTADLLVPGCDIDSGDLLVGPVAAERGKHNCHYLYAVTDLVVKGVKRHMKEKAARRRSGFYRLTVTSSSGCGRYGSVSLTLRILGVNKIPLALVASCQADAIDCMIGTTIVAYGEGKSIFLLALIHPSSNLSPLPLPS